MMGGAMGIARLLTSASNVVAKVAARLDAVYQ